MTVAPAGILDHFAKLLSLSSRKDPYKGALIYIVSSLSDLKLKLEEIKKRLKERDDELLSNAVKALNVNDRERVAIYASEIAEVRKLIRFVQIALLAVERLLERLKTMNIVNDIRVLSTTIGVLNQLKSMFNNTMPELAATLDTIVTNVNAIVAQTQTPELSVNVANVSKEVEDILKEIERQADEKIKHSLSPVPVQLENIISQQMSRDVMEYSKVVESMTSVGVTMPTSYTKSHKVFATAFDSGIEYQIYNYIIANRGLIKVDECATAFGLSKENVIAILRRLEQKGLIKIVT
jgi:division protein CdvB (Snf7/Vps24/ESCRT-III family)